MTDYEDSEYGLTSGSPVEAYRFTGTLQTYRYTSAESDVVIGGETFTPLTISHSAITVGSHDDDNQELEITVPRDVDIVQDYLYTIAPPRLLLEILRYHEGTDPGTDYIVLWKGYVTLYTATGHEAKLRVPSTFSLCLRGEVPNIWYQTPCNHVLFDARCSLVRTDFRTTTQIAAADGLEITVDNDGAVNHYLAGGEIVNTDTGERRIIIDNVDNVITIAYPFRNPSVDDNVELCVGCDHTLETCRDVFSNSINFGGFPYVPLRNPFEGTI